VNVKKKRKTGVSLSEANRSPHPLHLGQVPIQIGPYQVFAGAARDLVASDLEGFDLLIPLLKGDLPLPQDSRRRIHLPKFLPYPMENYGGVPDDFEFFLREVVRELESGKKVMAFCMGSHGRTGTFLAGLVSLLEPETNDPIEAIRSRHCVRAVETREQAEAVFALKGEALPVAWGSLKSAGEYRADSKRTARRWGSQRSVIPHW
jgi:hypothetical protein